MGTRDKTNKNRQQVTFEYDQKGIKVTIIFLALHEYFVGIINSSFDFKVYFAGTSEELQEKKDEGKSGKSIMETGTFSNVPRKVH